MNGDKTIEVRTSEALYKAIQKLIDENGYADIYVYCSKGKPNLWLPYEYDCFELDEASQPYLSDEPIIDVDTKMNGKVIFKFRCYKVEEILPFIVRETKLGLAYELTKEKVLTCFKAHLTYDEYNHYLKGRNGYAIHISDLEIFDEPKELSEFYTLKCNEKGDLPCNIKDVFGVEECYDLCKMCKPLTKAPQNFCYVEVSK